jgi:hypothetical protein
MKKFASLPLCLPLLCQSCPHVIREAWIHGLHMPRLQYHVQQCGTWCTTPTRLVQIGRVHHAAACRNPKRFVSFPNTCWSEAGRTRLLYTWLLYSWLLYSSHYTLRYCTVASVHLATVHWPLCTWLLYNTHSTLGYCTVTKCTVISVQ